MKTNLTGKIKFFNQAKGYGFIVSDGSRKEYFFHYSKLANPYNLLESGDPVSFDEGENQRGECAINIERLQR